MAIAHRHLCLGSSLQVMNFVSQRVVELQDTLRRWEDEFKMWASVDQRHEDVVPAIARLHIRDRFRELSRAMAAANNELRILRDLHSALKPCPDCGGTGEFQEDIESHSCKTCNGSGVRS